MFKRLLQLPLIPEKSFFLWGPRQTSKTTLLKRCYPDALRIDLLKTDELMRYLQRPALLREEAAALVPGKLIKLSRCFPVPGICPWRRFISLYSSTLQDAFSFC